MHIRTLAHNVRNLVRIMFVSLSLAVSIADAIIRAYFSRKLLSATIKAGFRRHLCAKKYISPSVWVFDG